MSNVTLRGPFAEERRKFLIVLKFVLLQGFMQEDARFKQRTKMVAKFKFAQKNLKFSLGL